MEESSPTSAGNNEWFTYIFMGQEKAAAAAQGVPVYPLVNAQAAQVAPDGQDIVFLPYLYGSNYDPRAKACLVGLEAAGRAEVVRPSSKALLSPTVHVEKLLRNRARPEAVRLAGGAAKSPIWAQIFADVFELPVEIVETEELGTLGCAMAAAVATGACPDLAAAAQRMVRIKARIQPDPAASAIYRRKYQQYKQVVAALAPLFGRTTASRPPRPACPEPAAGRSARALFFLESPCNWETFATKPRRAGTRPSCGLGPVGRRLKFLEGLLSAVGSAAVLGGGACGFGGGR